jgi:peptidoglycan/xylan/chitin deacetylase (PgdA/CDA1 family)
MPVALAPIVPRIAAKHGIALRLPGRGVLLTFDDGPHPDGTPAVLDRLDAAGVSGVFFLAGEQVERHADVAAEVIARGHELGLHCHRHRPMPLLSARAIGDDLARGAAAIAAAAGVSPRLHRPPYGAYSHAGLAATRAAGYQPLLWSRWGKDWRRWTTPALIASRSTRELGASEVILLHDADHYSSRDSWRRSVRALPAILEAIAHADELRGQPTGSGSGSPDPLRSQPT